MGGSSGLFWAMAVVLFVLGVFDIATTFSASGASKAAGVQFEEHNPLYKPFVASGDVTGALALRLGVTGFVVWALYSIGWSRGGSPYRGLIQAFMVVLVIGHAFVVIHNLSQLVVA